MDIDRLIAFYHELTPASLSQFDQYYSADAYFKDPFNEVTGIRPIQRIFTHMFTQVQNPRFVVTDKVVDTHGAMLVWEFGFGVTSWRGSKTQVIRGASHIKFDASGKVKYHRDYWDAAEELYMTLPVLGSVMRGLRRALAAA